MSTFHVVKSSGPTIIGLLTCRALKLVTLNYTMNIGPTAERDSDTAVLERARETGLCFNYKKMVVRCKRIPFSGNIIDADGIEPDPEKVNAICNMTAPTDVKELQTFLGLANYLGRFTPHLATMSAPLRDVCKTNVPYD